MKGAASKSVTDGRLTGLPGSATGRADSLATPGRTAARHGRPQRQGQGLVAADQPAPRGGDSSAGIEGERACIIAESNQCTGESEAVDQILTR